MGARKCNRLATLPPARRFPVCLESDLLTRLAQLIPGGRGSLMVQHLVEGGFKTIRAIESSAAGDLLGLPWFDLKQMSLLRQGLDLYNRAEALGEVDYS